MPNPFDFSCEDQTSRVIYTPWTDGWAVGFRCQHPDGHVDHVYLNPSGSSDDGVPTVFLYSGEHGHPALDDCFDSHLVLRSPA